MKLKEFFFFIVGFNMVMWLLATIGYTSLMGGFSSAEDYLARVTLGVIGTALTGLAGAAVTSIFFRERSGERTIMFISMSTLLFGIVGGSFAMFEGMLGGFSVFLNILTIIKVFVFFTMLFTIYQLVFGGWGSYE